MASAVPSGMFSLTSAPRERQKLSEQEREYVKQLVSIQPLDSILDGQDTERKCKELGQKIFNEFKSKASENSSSGREAVIKICEAIHFEGTDGRLRNSHYARTIFSRKIFNS